MNRQHPDLTEVERLILERSADSEVTRRRLRTSLLTALLLAILLIVVTLYLDWPWPLVAAFLAYIALTTYERWAYGRMVMLYKGLVRKLAAGSREE